MDVSRKKRKLQPNDSTNEAKKPHLNRDAVQAVEACVRDIPLNDWKLNMGATLADRLEGIALERDLTILQVKRLLKDVLTNPVVINAFKHYMSGQITLLEPETGEPSTSTIRQAQVLGFDASSFSRRSTGNEAASSDLAGLISHRVLTRSVVNQLRSQMSLCGSNFTKTRRKRTQSRRHYSGCGGDTTRSAGPRTLLDMHFSEGEEDVEEDFKGQCEKGVAVNETQSPIATTPDKEYRPTVDDLLLMQQDRAYDRGDDGDVDSIASFHQSPSNEESLEDMLETVEPINSPHPNYYLRSRKNDGVECCEGLTNSLLHMLHEDDADHAGFVDDVDPTLLQTTNDQLTTGGNDPEDRIYSNFLQSFFELGPSISSPMVHDVQSMGGIEADNQTQFHSELVQASMNDARGAGEDCDDPDFDVMAEIDAVCCEDLFDELRTDRAVRISKMEAKELRRELVELFPEDEYERDEYDDADLMTYETTAAKLQAPATAKAATDSQLLTLRSESRGEFAPLPPPPFDASTNERLRRQVSMHVQLLCSTYLCCANRADLGGPICLPMLEAFAELHATFRAAKQNQFSYVTGISSLNSLFNEARAFLREYGGLNMQPWQPLSTKTPQVPLPFFLLDFVLRSPIWAYPGLLPRGLVGRPGREKSRHLFGNDEDRLMVIGVANFIEFSPRRFNIFADSLTRTKDNHNSLLNSKVFDFIKKTIIPARTKVQLYNRKAYMVRLLQRSAGVIMFNARSPLYLMMLDLKSGNFESFEEKRSLLRACVSRFAERTRAATTEARWQAVVGSPIFGHPERWGALPREYALCCRALCAQIEEGRSGAPCPVLDPLHQNFFRDAPQNIEFFMGALMTWWPIEYDGGVFGVPDVPEDEVQEVSAYPLPSIQPSEAAPTRVAVSGAPSLVLMMPPPVCGDPALLRIATIPPPSTPKVSQRPPSAKPSIQRLLPKPPTLAQPAATPVSSRYGESWAQPFRDNPTNGATPLGPTQTLRCGQQLVPPLKPTTVVKKSFVVGANSSGTNSSSLSPRKTPPPTQLSPPFLPQIGKTIQTFYATLDRVSRGLSTETPLARATAGFLRSCRRSTASNTFAHLTAARSTDEADVRRAHALLDRCRIVLGRSAHAQLVRSLDDINVSSATKHLRRVLDILSPCRPLWEEFISLCCTPGQARALRVYPVYAHLQRLRAVHSALLHNFPRGKRVWSRLRRLADEREIEELREPSLECLAQPPVSGPPPPLEVKTKRRKRRRRADELSAEDREAQKPANEVHKAAWSVLEVTLKNRQALLAQTAIALDPSHKPYSNFPETFEVMETLARNPTISPKFSPTLPQQVAALPSPLPRLVNTEKAQSPASAAFDESMLWEVSTELSSRASATTKSKLVNRCPCWCHNDQQQTTSGSSSKQTSKADSLGLRHCIRCSLRVLQGVVYVDECNFHLTHVQINWPPSFSPPEDTAESCVFPLPSPEKSPSAAAHASPPPVSLPPAAAPPTTIRQVLHALGRYHENSIRRETAATVTVPVPDMARRQLSVNFAELTLAANSRKSSSSLDEMTGGARGARRPLAKDVSSTRRLFSSLSSSTHLRSAHPSAPPPLTPLPPATTNTHVVLDDDDDAACFNTEAFPQRRRHPSALATNGVAVVSSNLENGSTGSGEASSTAVWSLADDRRLLEHCRAVGRCTRQTFVDLASFWPERSVEEVTARFKYLMLIAFGEDYHWDMGSDSAESDEGGAEEEDDDDDNQYDDHPVAEEEEIDLVKDEDEEEKEEEYDL